MAPFAHRLVWVEQVELVEVERRLPAKVAFRFFETPLESFDVLSWQEGALRRLVLPAVGESVELPFSATPYSFQGKAAGLDKGRD
jgi:hypothetical protein